MTILHERILPDVRIEPATVRIPGGRASDRATAQHFYVHMETACTEVDGHAHAYADCGVSANGFPA